MKVYKENIMNRLAEVAREEKIISLRAIAESCGVKRLSTQECLEISTRFTKAHPDYKTIKMVKSEKELGKTIYGVNTFNSLTFVDKTLG